MIEDLDSLSAQEPYEFGGEISRGAAGIVYRANDIRIGRTVARKTLFSGSYVMEDKVRRFINEARITAQLAHPNIVPIHKLTLDEDGEAYYTMKLVKGSDLHEVLREVRKGNEEMIARYGLLHLLTIFQKICDAIAFAHAHGVIHRDLKPSNIMVGDYGEVLVMDWGLAKRLTADHDEAASSVSGSADEASDESFEPFLTMEGDILGTPNFMSPEQADGRIDDIDARTDIYALGGLLYNFLTLRPPFEGKNLNDILEKVRAGDITPPNEVDAGEHGLPHCPGGRVPDALSAVAMRALAPDPEHRYQSVTELQREIESYQTGFATQAEEATLWTQVKLFVRRNRALSLIVGLATIALIGVLVAGAWTNYRERVKAQRSQVDAENALVQFEAEQEQRLVDRKQSAPVFLEAARKAIHVRDFESARVNAEVAVEFNPDLSSCWMVIAQLDVAEGKFAQAMESLSKYLQFHVDDGRAERLLDLCERANEGYMEETRPELFEFFVDEKAFSIAETLADTRERVIRLYKAQVHDAWPGQSGNLQFDEDGKASFQLTHEFKDEGLISLEPLRGIPLKSLTIVGYGRVHDLAPLEGMPLEFLSLERTGVTDLTPLSGLPIKTLLLNVTRVADLAPLKGMPIEQLDLWRTSVSDLAPLEGMKLRVLNIAETRVSDISVLEGMPLVKIDLYKTGIQDLEDLRGMQLEYLKVVETAVTDLSPLAGMPLQSLDISNTQVKDMSPLKGMTLRELQAWNAAVRDIRPLQGMPLEVLNLANTKVSDISALKGMKLRSLDIYATQVEDISAVKDMPLDYLNVAETPVEDISALEGMRLQELNIYRTPVADISPLTWMPIKVLNMCYCVNVTDLSPLETCTELENLAIPQHVEKIEFLRDLPKLKGLAYNWAWRHHAPDMTAEEFWKRHDEEKKAEADRLFNHGFDDGVGL